MTPKARAARRPSSKAPEPSPAPSKDVQPSALKSPEPPPPAWAESLGPWLRWSIPALGLIAAVIVGLLYGFATAVLVLVGTALLMAISALWTSLQLLAGDKTDTPEEALELDTSRAVEEQKQLVLRALKDLEFERSMGKITEDDYRELNQRYRAQAKQLLQDLDRQVQPLRPQAEKLIADYLKQQGLSPLQPAAAKKESASEPVPSASQPTVCGACKTRNDADAKFCKSCGQPLRPLAQSSEARSE